MSAPVDTRTEYLEKLRDLLPYRDGRRILDEVDTLIQDRMDAEMAAGGAPVAEAERRALEALGPAERLAEELSVAPAISIDLATRRTFVRLLATTFVVHLLLSIVLTVAGSSGPAIPGILHPVTTQPLGALISSVLSILLVDTGALFLIFALFGRGKAPPQLPTPRLRSAASRRHAVLALVLLGLVALILHPFRDQIFAIRDGDHMVGILADPLVALLPFVDVVLGLLALRQVAILVAGGEHPFEVAVDALATLGLAVVLAVAATRPELVRFPEGTLGKSAAASLSELMTRVLLLVFVAGALFLAAHFVKRAFRLRQLIAAT